LLSHLGKLYRLTALLDRSVASSNRTQLDLSFDKDCDVIIQVGKSQLVWYCAIESCVVMFKTTILTLLPLNVFAVVGEFWITTFALTHHTRANLKK
ncbi:MAG: hypothetical protein RLY14_1919, partial [Planctomycetota bacterium]